MKRAESPKVSSLGQSDRRERRPRFIKQTPGKYSSPRGEVARSDGGGLYFRPVHWGVAPKQLCRVAAAHGCRTYDPRAAFPSVTLP